MLFKAFKVLVVRNEIQLQMLGGCYLLRVFIVDFAYIPGRLCFKLRLANDNACFKKVMPERSYLAF